MGGYFQSVFQFGQVSIETAGESPNFIMRYVPKPHVVANSILMIYERLSKSTLGETQYRRELSAASEARTKLPSNMYRDIKTQLNTNVANVNAPQDFEHDKFKGHLFEQDHQQQSNPPTPKIAEEAQPQFALASPNRLPPTIEPDDSEGELSEGETVSFRRD
jgi:hypothetical protein